jgi:hypothetical protein
LKPVKRRPPAVAESLLIGQDGYTTEMIDRAGQTVTTDLVVTVGADVATWAAQCGATTVEEAARRSSDAVDLDTLAECLGQLNTLPDGVTVDAEQQSVRGTLQSPMRPDRPESWAWRRCTSMAGPSRYSGSTSVGTSCT